MSHAVPPFRQSGKPTKWECRFVESYALQEVLDSLSGDGWFIWQVQTHGNGSEHLIIAYRFGGPE